MPLSQTIRERMIPIENYAIIAPEATLREAALSLRTIVQNKLSVLPVYDRNKAVGLIRDTDIFLTITENLEE